jgi:hypothetical protein
MPAAPRQPNFAILVTGAWLLLLLQLLIQYWPETAVTLNDSDDAMRLVQVREFLAGHGWFDLHMARVQPPIGYDPHWSRLIDAGLAGLFILFHQVFDTALAERLMRVTWPLLWLLPTIVGGAAIAWRMAGREAAAVVLLFAIVGLPAWQQFKPGRIDHHNVQIALVLLTVAATVWADRWRWAGIAAGVLTGLGFTIGFEGAHLLALCGVVLALRFVLGEGAARQLRDYGIAVAASTSVGFVLSVAPKHWMLTTCDAIAINTVLPTVVGGCGLALATIWSSHGRSVRLALVGVAAALAVATFALAEPRCLGGPYAMVDPQVKPIWLAHVREMQPLLSVFAKSPVTAVGIVAFPGVAVIAVAVLAWRSDMRRDPAFLTAAAALLMAFATTFAAIKGFSYAMWLSMPLVAVLALRLFAALHLKTLLPRFLAGLLLTPVTLSASAIGIAAAAGLDHGNAPHRGVCLKNASYAAFNRLPPGLVATDIDFGPFLLALTPHSVLAAPYHRLSGGIVAAHDIFALPLEQGRRLIDQWHVTYIAVCRDWTPVGMNGPERDASLWGRLHADALPDWLTREPLPRGTPFSIYRVRS